MEEQTSANLEEDFEGQATHTGKETKVKGHFSSLLNINQSVWKPVILIC